MRANSRPAAFYLESLTVTASGVHVQNFDVRGAITAQPDTALVAVE